MNCFRKDKQLVTSKFYYSKIAVGLTEMTRVAAVRDIILLDIEASIGMPAAGHLWVRGPVG